MEMRKPTVVGEVEVSLRMEQGQVSKRDMCRVAAALSFKQTIVAGSLNELWLKQSCVHRASRNGGSAD